MLPLPLPPKTPCPFSRTSCWEPHPVTCGLAPCPGRDSLAFVALPPYHFPSLLSTSCLPLLLAASNTVTSPPLHPPPVSPSSPPKHGDWYHSACRPPPQTAGRKPPRSLSARCVTFSIFIYKTGLAGMFSEGPVGLILEDSPYSCRDKPRDMCVCMYACVQVQS